jgi:PadR family transcriptional regulator, regulatory protein PadR
MTKNSEHRVPLPAALEVMILQSLRLCPMYGYAVCKHIKPGDLLQVEEGRLYPALQRLPRKGLLESGSGASAKGCSARINRVGPAGLRHLEQEVSSFEKMSAGITRILTLSQT